MITRFVLLLVSAAALIMLGPPGVASANPCGEVRYSSHIRDAPPAQASPTPSSNPLEPEPSGPGCKRAARTGAVAVSAAAALVAALTAFTRFLRGWRRVTLTPVGPVTPPVVPARPTPPMLHNRNASLELYMRTFPELTGVNLGYRYPTPEWSTNCQSCCAAAEWVFRGAKDVTALPRVAFDPARRYKPSDSHGGDWRSRLGKYALPGADWDYRYDTDEVARALAAFGPGARAIVYGVAVDSTGRPVSHVFNAVNRGGTVCFVDAQTGRWADTTPYFYFQILRTN